MPQLKLVPLTPHPQEVEEQIFLKEIDLESGKTFLKAAAFCPRCGHLVVIVQEIPEERDPHKRFQKGLPLMLHPQVDEQIFLKEIDLESGKAFLKASALCDVCKYPVDIVQEILDE